MQLNFKWLITFQKIEFMQDWLRRGRLAIDFFFVLNSVGNAA